MLSGDDLFEKLINGETITEEIKTRRGIFKIKYPLGEDLIKITKRKSELLDGIDVNKVQKEDISNADVFATLDVVIVEAPEWWKKIKTAARCPDLTILLDLYRGFLRFYEETQRSIQAEQSRTPSRKSKSEKQTEVMGDAPFSGITL